MPELRSFAYCTCVQAQPILSACRFSPSPRLGASLRCDPGGSGAECRQRWVFLRLLAATSPLHGPPITTKSPQALHPGASAQRAATTRHDERLAMTVPHSDFTKQPASSPPAPPGTAPARAALGRTPANDAEPGPGCCPACGRPFFGPQSSALLDLVILIHESAGQAKAVLEGVVVP
jgi:hypothetical protein